MDKSKDKSPKLIDVTIDSLVTTLCRADELGKLPGQGIFDAAACIVPFYLEDLADVGEWLLSQVNILPNGHPTKSKYDWKKVEQGVHALKSGRVAVIVDHKYDHQFPEGDYQIRIVDD